TTTVTPWDSISWSPSWAPRSKPSAYSKPEQPPPWTATRRTVASPSGSSAIRPLILAAALSVSTTNSSVLSTISTHPSYQPTPSSPPAPFGLLCNTRLTHRFGVSRHLRYTCRVLLGSARRRRGERGGGCSTTG